MTDYTELIRSLRCENTGDDECGSSDCTYWSGLGCMDGQLMEDAAAAIEALQAQLPKRGKPKRGKPKRGKWIPYEFNTNGTWHKCSVCGVAYQYKDAPKSGWWINHKYCPNCGADMRKMEVSE